MPNANKIQTHRGKTTKRGKEKLETEKKINSCRLCSGIGIIHLQRMVNHKLITEGTVTCIKCHGIKV